jgi:fatty-acyl-CoA synthase
VVRRADPVWGEVPIAFVVRSEDSVSVDHLLDSCRRNLPGHKMPKEIHFIPSESMPRSSSGKVLRHELEKLLVEP